MLECHRGFEVTNHPSRVPTPRKMGCHQPSTRMDGEATCRPTGPGVDTQPIVEDGHPAQSSAVTLASAPHSHRSERRRQALQASPPWRKSECQGTSMGWSEVGTPQGIVGLILNPDPDRAIQKAPPATRAQRGWSHGQRQGKMDRRDQTPTSIDLPACNTSGDGAPIRASWPEPSSPSLITLRPQGWSHRVHVRGPAWQSKEPERAFNPSSKNHRKGGHERRHDPSEWTCARTQDRWPRLIEHHAHPTTRSRSLRAMNEHATAVR